MRTIRRGALAGAVLVSLLVAGCGTPGGNAGDNTKKAEESKKNSAKVDVAKAGNVTLTIWDQEVRGGQAAQIKRLNAAFLAKYPNVKIKRVAKSFTDLQTTLKLAVSSNKAPDVVEANQGRPIMGQLVKGGLLKPLDAYADAYGWKDRWSQTLLDLNRFSADGKQFGAGNLYGVSQQGEIVGVFYNKDKVKTVPSTFAEFEQMLAKSKKAGEVPISFGNLDKFGGIHEFQTVQNAFAGKQATRDFVFAKDGASFDTPENREAAAKLQEWADKGYFTPNFNGTGYDPAWQQFTKGKGPFTIAGTWITNDALKALGLKLGFFLMPGREAGSDPVALGGESLPWAITAKSKNADVAAAYLDFLTNAEAADVQVETQNLPAMAGASVRSKAPAVQDIFTAWKDLSDSDGLTPYMDYATPTFYEDFSGAVQKLMAGKLQPGAFTKSVQEDYAKFTDTL
jgi:raffinose/stachyose/melibiose transport system substrate-binding protein